MQAPFFNADDEAKGVPAEVSRLREEVDACQLLIFATPEYNGTTPGLVLNAVEWLSRIGADVSLHGVSIPRAHHHFANSESKDARTVDDDMRGVLDSAIEDALIARKGQLVP